MEVKNYKTLIVDGPDGAGKSTLLNAVFGEALPRTVQALPTAEFKAACRADPTRFLRPNVMFEHVCAEMVSAVERGVRVFDRAWPSTIVYQGMDADLLRGLPAITLPTLVYIILPSKNEIMARATKRGDAHFGLNNERSLAEIYDGYLRLLSLHSIQGMPGIDVIVDTGPNIELFTTAAAGMRA